MNVGLPERKRSSWDCKMPIIASRSGPKAVVRVDGGSISMRVVHIFLGFVILLMLAATTVMSNPMLPYDPGSTQNIPSAAARLSNISCSRSDGGYLFSFSVQVFGTAWKPVYRISIEEAGPAIMRPVGCPLGWGFINETPNLLTRGPVSFGTSSTPIPPGEMLQGFVVSSETSPVEFRWFPGDQDGAVIGKVSKESFECPLDTDPSTWGSIKAMYR